MYYGLAVALKRVYVYCLEKRRNEFFMREIRDTIGKIEYARFNDWIKFGGLVYRPKDKDGKIKKGFYGINMERTRDFFTGKLAIPSRIYKNPITKELEIEDPKTINNLPKLAQLLDVNLEYIVDYKQNLLL